MTFVGFFMFCCWFVKFEFIVVSCMCICHFVYFNMIKIHKLYHVSLLLATLPVFVLLSSYLILGEKINYTHLVAMFIIVVGLVMLESHQGILT